MMDQFRTDLTRVLPRAGFCLLMSLLFLAVAGCGGSGSASQSVGREQAVKDAYKIYRERRASNMNFFRGPCISNGKEISGWVVDVAHRPRQAVDDLPENQCSAYANGR